MDNPEIQATLEIRYRTKTTKQKTQHRKLKDAQLATRTSPKNRG